MPAETAEAPERALHPSTSSSVHLMFNADRMPTIRLQRGSAPGDRMSLYFEAEAPGFPGHDARAVLTGHRADLLALLDQARTTVQDAPEPEPPSPAELAEAERAGR